MGWVQTMIEQQNLLDGLKTLMISAGWQEKKSFIKAYYKKDTAFNQAGCRYAKHIILQSATNKLLGLCVKSDMYETALSSFPDTSNKAGFLAAIQELAELDLRTMYAYLIEKVPSNLTDFLSGETLSDIPIYVDDATVLGIETYQTTDGITINDLEIMQSPIVPIEFRTIDGNWWPDSKVEVVGHVNEKRMFLAMNADTLPKWENNQVPVVPLFFGDIESFDPSDTVYNTALFGGGVTVSSAIMPPDKSYPTHPGDGITSVIVHRGSRGGRYQAHYLSLALPPDKMRPEREAYPRAWHTRYDHPSYNMQFNPSRSTGRVHTSCIYVVHPEEGVRGTLADMIGVVPMSLVDGDKLIVNEGPKAGTYQFLLIEGKSVLTQAPGVAYRPIGVALKL